MKTAMFTMGIILISSIAFGQNPPNFVGTDCNGQQHDLFAELDKGKVIVICWVMPCGACTGPAKTSHNIVKSYQSQYPGKVLFYLVDDYGNTNCSYVSSWASTQNLPTSEFCSRFSAPALKMTDYGGDGMPKVVIIGGPNHKIYYNANSKVNSDDMLSAINTAIDQTTDVENGSDLSQSQLTVHPNPASQDVSISFTLGTGSDVNIEFVNGNGEIVKSYAAKGLNAGHQNLNLSTMALPTGTYFVRVQTHDGVRVTKCVVAR